jgi:hypothetical protein
MTLLPYHERTHCLILKCRAALRQPSACTCAERSRSELREGLPIPSCNKCARAKGCREIAEQRRYSLALGADLTYDSGMG